MKRKFLYCKRSKYFSKTARCLQGHLHHSRLEAGYCNQLEVARKAKLIKSFETQKMFRLVVNGKTICQHTPDFLVTLLDGRQEVHETKGMALPVWRLKMKLFKALYPEIPYRVIK